MALRVLNTIVIGLFLVLLVLSNGSGLENHPAITGIEIGIGTFNVEGANVILSLRIRDNQLKWRPWQPKLTTKQFKTVRRYFDDDILCVISGVDLVGLRLLRFRTKNNKLVDIKSDFPRYYPFLCGYPRLATFSFKGYPLKNISIDSSESMIKTYWDRPFKKVGNKLVVLDSGNGTFKQYIIKSTEDSSPPNDSCYWSDERAFLSRGRINAVMLESGEETNRKEYNMALSVRYGQSWETHGHYENASQKHNLKIKNIIAFAYDYKNQVIGFKTKQTTYSFGTRNVRYKTFSLFGRECIVAFFTGYSRMQRRPKIPWLLRAEHLFRNRTIIRVDPHWICEIPNTICKKNVTGHFDCACMDGYIEHKGLCKKACSRLISDNYLGMDILENTNCPRKAESVCNVVNCMNKTVSFTCSDGSWKPTNTSTISPSSRLTSASDCNQLCYFDVKSKNCVTNQNRGKTPGQIQNMLNDSIHQVNEAVKFCFKNREECRKRRFKCFSRDGTILMRKVCDHIKDCTDASDELCGANRGFPNLFAGLGGLLGLFSGLFSGGKLDLDIDKDKPETGCSWTSWTEITDNCDSMCGKADRKGKTDAKFGYGKNCQKRRKTRKRRCEKDNDCLTCSKSKCRVDVSFKNFKEPDSLTDLRAFINTKVQGGKVSFSTSFTSNKICSCQITNEYELKCKAKLKGRTTFLVNVKNAVDEKLAMRVNITIGDYPVKFILDKLDFTNFLESRTVNASEVAKDEDKEDEIEFTRVELTDNPGRNLLIAQEKKIKSLYFQIEMFVAGEINCSITVKSGGSNATSIVRLIIGKDLYCPSCKAGNDTCKKQIVYEYFDFENLTINQDDSEMFYPRTLPIVPFIRKRIRKNIRKRMEIESSHEPKFIRLYVVDGFRILKLLKRRIVIEGCSLPYNQYFKQWIRAFDIRFDPYPSLHQSPYVLGLPFANVYYTRKFERETTTVDTVAKYRNEIKKIYKKGVKKMKKITRNFIDKLHECNLIGFATLYKLKPQSVSEKLNIQFDHIPPQSAHPASVNKNLFSQNAPTLAISNFDHRSEVWRKCSTGNNRSTPIHNLYGFFMKKYNYACAIFANLKCFRDVELKLDNDDRLYDGNENTAFKRYSNGFKGLVNLHFDYGTNFNFAYKVNSRISANRPYAAYCEIKQPDFDDPKSECNRDSENCVEETFNGKKYYYRTKCANYKPYITSKLFKDGRVLRTQKQIRTERNILRRDQDMLTKFIDGSKHAEKSFWNKCCNSTSIYKCNTYLDEPI